MFKKIIYLMLLPMLLLARDWVQIRDGDGDGLVADVESNSALAVNVQDQTSFALQSYFIRSTETPMVLQDTALIDSYWVFVQAAHTFDSLDLIFMADNNRSFLAMVLDTNADTLFLDSPVPYGFIPDSAVVLEVTNKLNVNGSATRLTYTTENPSNSNFSFDITGVRFIISDAPAMDNGKFGGIDAIERGCVLRKKAIDGTAAHYGNFKSNGDFKLVFNNGDYDDKAPAGENSFSTEWEIAGQQNMGVTIRLRPGECLDLIIQDNLTALTGMRGYIFGHYVTD